jgi:hypothetical protein
VTITHVDRDRFGVAVRPVGKRCELVEQPVHVLVRLDRHRRDRRRRLGAGGSLRVSSDGIVESHRAEPAAAVDSAHGEESRLVDGPADPSDRVRDRRPATVSGFLHAFEQEIRVSPEDRDGIPDLVSEDLIEETRLFNLPVDDSLTPGRLRSPNSDEQSRTASDDAHGSH